MRRVKDPDARFRVGDWVAFLYGPRLVLGQVIEDRGLLGLKGRRLYGVRLEQPLAESSYIEIPEDELDATSEAERLAWQARGSIATHQTLTYFPGEEGTNGEPTTWDHYLIVVKPDSSEGPGVATIIPALLMRPTCPEVGQTHVISVEGGPDEAFAKAEEYLDAQHPGWRKERGERRP